MTEVKTIAAKPAFGMDFQPADGFMATCQECGKTHFEWERHRPSWTTRLLDAGWKFHLAGGGWLCPSCFTWLDHQEEA